MTTASAAPKEAPATDAISQLQRQHGTIAELFDYFHDTPDPLIRKAIAHRLCRLVAVQIAIEEELIYPAVRRVLRDRDVANKVEFEGSFVRKVAAQVMSLPHEDQRFAPTVEILGDYVHDYIDQQRTQILPRLKRGSKQQLAFLGSALADRRAELLARA